MKNRQIMGMLTFLILGTLLGSGCSNTGPASATPVAAPAPQIAHTTVPVSPSATTIATPAVKHRAGDIVWRNERNYDTDLHRSRGMIILQVNEQSYNYQHVSKDDGDILWSQIYPNEEIDTIVSFEKNCPRNVDHVASITSRYPSRAAFEEAISNDMC